jgi:hypothetical protein
MVLIVAALISLQLTLGIQNFRVSYFRYQQCGLYRKFQIGMEKREWNPKHTNFSTRSVNNARRHYPELNETNISRIEGSRRTNTVDISGGNQLSTKADQILDLNLVRKTIEEWQRPLPKNYVSQPLILVGYLVTPYLNRTQIYSNAFLVRSFRSWKGKNGEEFIIRL